ncbi:MAG: ribbon-helix-helix protein, CopG family [Rhodospirillaceae bacterium]|nr:ribbon-helix-helix protein, CopG family [Rhodospirillaceae bacterium]
MTTKVVTAHLPLALAKKVDKLAKQLDRPRGWLVKQALTDLVELEERRYQMTLEGLADIDAGRLIDHEDIAAWAKSLGTDKPLPPPRPK